MRKSPFANLRNLKWQDNSSSWLQSLKNFIYSRSPLNRLIVINVAVWLFLLILSALSGIFGFLFVKDVSFYDTVLEWIGISADYSVFLHRPWTLISNMFVHFQFWHLLTNMLVLYFAGKIFMQYGNPQKLYVIYFVGGIVGSLLYQASYNFFPVFENITQYSFAIGASGAVMAILAAAATKAPSYQVNLFGFIKVKMVTIALSLIVIDVLSLTGNNSGGHFAHLGGAAFGFLYSFLPTVKFNKIKTGKKQTQRPKTDQQYNDQRAKDRKKMDSILDKIAQSGYDKLSKEEKEFLFKTSQKNNL